MRISLPLIAAGALALGACAVSPYGYGYNRTYSPVYGSIGALGSAYGGNFQQAAINACAGYASRYGQVTGIRNVRALSSSRLRVYGYVNRGYRSEGWDCTFRSDGRITDFDL